MSEPVTERDDRIYYRDYDRKGKRIERWTRRTWFRGFTGPTGAFGFNYAIIARRGDTLFIPVHDLTPATREKLGSPVYHG